MAKIEKKTKRYPSDLTDEEWAKIEPFSSSRGEVGASHRGRFAGGVERNPLRGAFGRGWRTLPNDFPPWQTVYWWFRRFVRRFMFQTIHDVALMLDREHVGREASPTGEAVDSQSVKAPEAKTRGYDEGKKIAGRKRHIAVGTDGRLLMVNLTPADISDSAWAQMILDGVRKRWPWLKHLFADGAYDRTQLMDKAAFLDFTTQVVKRSDTAKGFEVIPRRWVVECTFAWMTRWRSLVRDYEERIDCSEAMIHVALRSLLLGRIAHE
jgi:putative transposase